MRPRACALPRLVRGPVAALLSIALGFFAVQGARAQPGGERPTDKVRVTYEAPPACPDEATFLSEVRARIGVDWEASSTERARQIAVSVATTAGGSTARLDYVDDGGRPVSRALSGTTCTDVVAAIALVTALAIDARFTEALASSQPAEPAAPEAAPAPSGSGASPAEPEKRAEPVAASAVGAAPAQSVTRAGPRTWEVTAGVLGAIASGTGPAVALGGRAFAGLKWRGGADVRLGFDYLTVAPTRIARNDGDVVVATRAIGGRLSGCPLALALGSAVSVSPCAGLASGAFHGETLDSPGVQAKGSANPAFFALFGEARVDVRFDALFIEASGEVRFVVDPPTFALVVGDLRPQLYDAPVVSVGATLGLGLLL